MGKWWEYVTDTEEELSQIVSLTSKLNCEYELLKYHRLGEPKYVSLHRPYLMGDVELDDARFERLKNSIRKKTALTEPD